MQERNPLCQDQELILYQRIREREFIWVLSIQKKQLFNTPGPGTYQSDGKKDGPCYTIGGIGMKGKYETVSPGPAAYDLIHSYQQIYNAKPGKSFGKKNLI